MQSGRFPVEMVRGVPVVAAPEEIDITNAPDLRSALLAAAADGYGRLVADLTRTRFCDSSGLHALLAAHKCAQADGGELLLVITNAAVLRIFALTCIDRMIPSFTSLDDALAHTSPADQPAAGGLMTGLRAVPWRQPAQRRGTAPAVPAGKRADRHATCLPPPSLGNRADTTEPPQSS
jgi:anti-sigma B factor antagonist